LNRVQSNASGDPAREFTGGQDPEVDTELRDMIYEKTTGSIAMSNHEPILL